MKTTKQKNRIDHRKVVMDWVMNWVMGKTWLQEGWQHREFMANGRKYAVSVLRQNNVITTVSYQVKYNGRLYPEVCIENLLITDQQLKDHRAAMQGGDGENTAQPTGQVTAPVTEQVIAPVETYTTPLQIAAREYAERKYKVFINYKTGSAEEQREYNDAIYCSFSDFLAGADYVKTEIEQLKKQAEINGKDYAALQSEYVRVSQELNGYQKENKMLRKVVEIKDRTINDLANINDAMVRQQQTAQLTVEPERLLTIFRAFGFSLSDGNLDTLKSVINLYIATNGNPTLSQVLDALNKKV